MKSTLLILTMLASLSTQAQDMPPITLSAQQQAAFGIQTAPVQAVTHTLSQPYPASVAVPNAQLQVVSAPMEGVVEAMLVAEGEQVKSGQALARLHSPGLLELQNSYLAIRTRRQLSAENLERDRSLFDEGIIAKRRLLESEAGYRELVNAEARDRQALQLAGMPEAAIAELARKQQLSSVVEITAPFDGVILEQLATTGRRLATSDPLYRIAHLSPLWIEVHVPLEALGDLAPGSEIRVTEAELPARVITVGHMVHGSDQGVLIRAEISQGIDQLRPGQFVEARLALGTTQNALRVPVQAVVRQASQDYVFVQQANGYVPTPVQVLEREADGIVLKGSLAAGDRVVTSGTAALKAAWPGGEE